MKCKHDWWVYSTSICPPRIMLECKKCHKKGRVDNYTPKEWKKAFYSPSRPFKWGDSTRVIIKGDKR